MKNVAVLTEDGSFALFFRSHPGGFDSSRVHTPGNLPSKAKQKLMPGAQPGGGAGHRWNWLMYKNVNCNALRSKLLLARVSVSLFRSASLRFKETTGFYPTSFSDQLSTTYFRSYLYNDTPSSISYFFIFNNNRVIFTIRNYNFTCTAPKHHFQQAYSQSVFHCSKRTEQFSG